MARTALGLVLLALFALAGRAEALQRVVFTDGYFLEVEDAWADDKYVNFIYKGRPITVLRSDVARIEGARPRRDGAPPPAVTVCQAPHAGDNEVAIRGYFRCMNVTWARSPTTENGHQLWVYQGWVRGRLEKYVLEDGRVVESRAGDGQP